MAFLAGTLSLRAEQFVYFGTYTGAKSKGIYCWRMSDDGGMKEVGLVATTASPSFLATHPNGKFLYAVGEVANVGAKKTGVVSAFAIDGASGQLKLLNQQSSGGGGPCHLTVDPSGRTVLVANYGGGSVAALPILADGSLAEGGSFIQHQGSSVNKSRQEGPHGHAIVVDPTHKFALACDLGLDQVLIYKLDAANARLTPHQPPFATLAPGSGPRHIAFRPDGQFAYVINEMLCTMTVFAWDGGRGVLKEVQTISTLPGSVEKGYSTAEVYTHPTGRFVYGSNRGHDSIVVYACDEKTGRLTLVQHQPTLGRTPRHFAIHPGGKFLLAENQSSDTVAIFRIDPATGRLTAHGEPLAVPSPVCAVFVPVK